MWKNSRFEKGWVLPAALVGKTAMPPLRLAEGTPDSDSRCPLASGLAGTWQLPRGRVFGCHPRWIASSRAGPFFSRPLLAAVLSSHLVQAHLSRHPIEPGGVLS